MNDEFQKYLGSSGEAPNKVFSKVSKIVEGELNPPFSQVFLKLSGVHLLVGTLTLFVCPQFGLGFFEGMGLMALFMTYGKVACMIGCGTVFLSGSLLVASLALRPEEVNVLRRARFSYLSLLSTLSFAAMICFGAEVVYSLGLFWIFGSMLGGMATLEAGWYLRRKVA